MEGLKSLAEKILDDARKACEEIIKKAEAEADELVRKSEAEAKARVEEIIKRSEARAEEIARRITARAEAQVKLAWERARAQVLEEVFQGALEALRNLPEGPYLNWLSRAICDAATSGGEEVVLSDRDKRRFGERLIDRVNAELAKAGRPGNLRLSGEARDISGGFVLISPNVEINSSFEALLAEHREELEQEVAGFLFGPEGDGQ